MTMTEFLRLARRMREAQRGEIGRHRIELRGTRLTSIQLEVMFDLALDELQSGRQPMFSDDSYTTDHHKSGKCTKD